MATIRKIKRTSNPSSFDYEEFLASKSIYATGYSKSLVQVIRSQKDPFQNIVISVRKFLRKQIEHRFGDYAGFIKAIIIADKSELDERRNILNKAGLSHLLAVSGLHVGILSLVFFSILNMIIPRRNISRIVLIIILVIYGAICLWAPSVTRAAIMISLYLISVMIQRKPDANNILAASLIIITAIQPEQLFSVGLQMSYLAVLVLLNVLPRFRFVIFKKDEIEILTFSKKILNGVLILLLTSFILNIFLAPLTLFYFNQFSLNGILGNLLGIPLISILLPLSILIVFLPEIGFLISMYQASFKVLMLLFDYWSQFSASFPLFFGFLSFNFYQLIISYLLLVILVFWFINVRNKRSYLYFTAIIILIIFLSLFGKGRTDKLKITFFDCGLGDLFLIETPANETILIDSGPPKTSKSFGKSALSYLKDNGLQTLDWVIITHAHNDHYGGLETALDELDIKRLVVTDEFQTRKIWKKLKNKIISEKCEIITISDTTHLSTKKIRTKILHPDKLYSDKNINNLSIITRIDYLDFSVLFTGDLEQKGEEYLLQNYPGFLDCDFLKVGHHGSKTSSTPAFLKAVTPDYALISTSMKNRFNFPHKITLEKYGFLDKNLYISGKDGALQIITDGKTAQFKTFLSEKEFIDNALD